MNLIFYNLILDKKKLFASEYARQYRDKYGSKISSAALARLLKKDFPLIFKDAENARFVLRYIEGKAGSKNRKKIINKSEYMQEERTSNPYGLPEFVNEERKPITLPKQCDNILVLADLHIPYSHAPSINKAFKYGLDKEVNTIILLGDVLDNHHISKYQSDPSKRNQKFEFDTCKAFLVSLRKTFPNALIYWLKGNHDVRYERWLLNKAPEIFGDPYYLLEERLKLNEEKVVLVSDKVPVIAGKLTFHHGHYMFGAYGPINPGVSLHNKVGTDMMVGHLHRHVQHQHLNLSGKLNYYILGCLSEIGLNVDYNPIVNQYRRGFAHVIINKDGSYKADLIEGEN
jgi:predicted phosphodiesterase